MPLADAGTSSKRGDVVSAARSRVALDGAAAPTSAARPTARSRSLREIIWPLRIIHVGAGGAGRARRAGRAGRADKASKADGAGGAARPGPAGRASRAVDWLGIVIVGGHALNATQT